MIKNIIQSFTKLFKKEDTPFVANLKQKIKLKREAEEAESQRDFESIIGDIILGINEFAEAGEKSINLYMPDYIELWNSKTDLYKKIMIRNLKDHLRKLGLKVYSTYAEFSNFLDIKIK